MRYTARLVEFRPRHAFEARIQILLERNGQSLTVQEWAPNLSEGGVNAFVAHSLSLGEFVMLEISFPDAASHDIPAQVVRALGTEYGFQLTALSLEQRQQIQSALQGHSLCPVSDRNDAQLLREPGQRRLPFKQAASICIGEYGTLVIRNSLY